METDAIPNWDSHGLCVAALLFRVDMPDNVVGEAVDSVPSSFGHFCKPFGLCLILESIAREVYACAHVNCSSGGFKRRNTDLIGGHRP